MNAAPILPTSPRTEVDQTRLPRGLVSSAQVVSSPEREGKMALQIRGQTYEANLPASIKEGSEVTIKVVHHGELLEVKLLNSSLPSSSPSSSALSTAEELKLLQILKAMPSQVPSRPEMRQLYELLQALSKGVEFSHMIKGSLDREVLLQGLAQHGFIPEDHILSPDAIKEVLKAIVAGSQNTAKSGTEITAKLLELLNNLKLGMEGGAYQTGSSDSLQAISTSIMQLASAVDSKQLAGQIDQLLQKIATTRPAALNLSLHIQSLAIILEQISSKGTLQIPVNPQDILALSEQLADPSLKQVGFERIFQSLSQLLFGEANTDSKTSGAASRNDLLRLQHSLESIQQTQDLLQKVNTFMQHLQEPVMVLLPAALKDMFWLWQLKFDFVDNNPTKDGSGGDKYHRFTLQLSLPSLGDIEVRCAHSGEEALVNLKFDGSEKVEFADQFSHYLKNMLHQIGIKQSMITHREGPVEKIDKQWLKSYSGQTMVA